MAKKRIVVLGAGYGGLQAAKTLHKKLKKQDIDILLIDQNDHHTLLTELHEVAGHRIEPDGVKVSVQHVLEYTKVCFVQDKILAADLEAQVLTSAENTYPYDYLVLAAGSEPAYFEIPGIEEHGFTLWSLEDAKAIRAHILKMFAKAAQETDPALRAAYLTFVVGGGGFTGVEMIGELMEWTRSLCKQFHVSREEIKLVLVEALPTILPILNDKLIKKSTAFMEKRGVKILVNAPIVKVSPDSLTVKGGKAIPARTVIWTGGIQTKAFVKDLGITLGNRNRIVVNDCLQTLEYPNVYAIGDNMEFSEDNGEVLPPLVETALQSGKCAANNIASELSGKEKEPFKASLHGVMVSIGSVFAVAQLKGMPLLSGIWAMLMKHLVNLHYLFEIGGFELIWDYFNHQFLHKERKYNFAAESVIGHAKQRSFTFWLVPLRVWLGVMWLTSGLHKIAGEWFLWDVIGPVDGTTSATVHLVNDHTPRWYAWIVETFIYPNNMLFQHIIVYTEILLGLAFIFGAFTFIAAIGAIGMNINFMLTTGLPTVQGYPDLWYLTASIAMLAGAGRVLGADYYLMPWLTRQIRYFQRNKAIHPLKGWKW